MGRSLVELVGTEALVPLLAAGSVGSEAAGAGRSDLRAALYLDAILSVLTRAELGGDPGSSLAGGDLLGAVLEATGALVRAAASFSVAAHVDRLKEKLRG